MTTNPPEASRRLDAFSEAETRLIRQACVDVVGRIQDAAMASEIPEDQRVGAGATFLLAARLSLEADEHLGEAHPPLSIFEVSAELIASGTYAEQIAAVRAEALGQVNQG